MATTLVQPVLAKPLPEHPNLHIEVIVDYGLTHIEAGGYDAAVRLGDQMSNEMIAMRIGPEMRMAMVGTSDYFDRHPLPEVPGDLFRHNCITIRLPAYGGIFPWAFEKVGKEVNGLACQFVHSGKRRFLLSGDADLSFGQDGCDGMGVAQCPFVPIGADGSASVRRQHVRIIEQTRRQLIARFAAGGDQFADARGGDFQRSDRQGDQLARRQ